MPTKPLTPIDYYLRGLSIAAVARKCKLDRKTVRRILTEAGHEIRPRIESVVLASMKPVTCELCGHAGGKSTFSKSQKYVICMTCIAREYEGAERGCRKCRTWKPAAEFRGDRRVCIACQAAGCRAWHVMQKKRAAVFSEIDRIMVQEKAWAILRGREETAQAKAWARMALQRYGAPDHAGISPVGNAAQMCADQGDRLARRW